MYKCDILSLEWNTSGRDAEVLRLVKYALCRMGYTIQTESIFNWRWSILKHKPKLILTNDTMGDYLNGFVCKAVLEANLPSISFVNEGDFVEGLYDFFIWGWNHERVVYQKRILQWSERTRNITIGREPQIAEKIFVSGAIGFDRYMIYKFMKKEELLNKYGKNYKKVVGYAAWSLDTFSPEDRRYKLHCELYGEEQVKSFQKDAIILREVFSQMIKNNPEILFVFKAHPGTMDFSKTEITGFNDFPNVLCLKNEETISDLLSACDLWMAFESTTCMEAWLLGKQTLIINPTVSDFMRSHISQGSPILKTVTELQEAFDSFYSSGKIPGFEEKGKTREQIIKDTIQFDDGKNHMRAANLIDHFMKNNSPAVQFKKFSVLLALAQKFVFYVSPFVPFGKTLKRYRDNRIGFKPQSTRAIDEKLRPQADSFALNHKLDEKDLVELARINPI